MVGLCKHRIKLDELCALIDVKQERLKELENEAVTLRAEIVLLTNELMCRSVDSTIRATMK